MIYSILHCFCHISFTFYLKFNSYLGSLRKKMTQALILYSVMKGILRDDEKAKQELAKNKLCDHLLQKKYLVKCAHTSVHVNILPLYPFLLISVYDLFLCQGCETVYLGK